MDKKILLPLLILSSQIASAQVVADFGSGANSFSIDFVTIGNPGNVADTTGQPNPAGSVAYIYAIGKYEVSRDMILKATSAGGLGITLADMTTLGGNGLDRPATGVTWHEAAKFVNWLNTSKGYQAAYRFDISGNFQLWSAGQYSGTNQYRHKDAFYFLPTSAEWYKAAFGNPDGRWSNYPNGLDSLPASVSGGTANNTAVYLQPSSAGPADIKNAGGLSGYGTMAQGGNVMEWIETAFDGVNNTTGENRETRDGPWDGISVYLESSVRNSSTPTHENSRIGFRVASVPEPSSASLFILGLATALARRRR